MNSKPNTTKFKHNQNNTTPHRWWTWNLKAYKKSDKKNPNNKTTVYGTLLANNRRHPNSDKIKITKLHTFDEHEM